MAIGYTKAIRLGLEAWPFGVLAGVGGLLVTVYGTPTAFGRAMAIVYYLVGWVLLFIAVSAGAHFVINAPN